LSPERRHDRGEMRNFRQQRERSGFSCSGGRC
jgi:hypothetical protein